MADFYLTITDAAAYEAAFPGACHSHDSDEDIGISGVGREFWLAMRARGAEIFLNHTYGVRWTSFYQLPGGAVRYLSAIIEWIGVLARFLGEWVGYLSAMIG